MESALTGPYADMVKEHFMKCVPPTDHKFAALHGAVWSGGSFVYVPAGVHVDIPLQSYFRLNAPGAGQFEHTLIIVDKGAYLHLSRLLGPEVQRRQPARRLRRDFSSVRVRACATPRLKTGPRICTT